VSQVSARKALGFAVERANLLLYGVVTLDWLVFSERLQGVTCALTNVLAELHAVFGTVRALLRVSEGVVLLAGLVGLGQRAVAETARESDTFFPEPTVAESARG
jgi:hypothetical protein